MNAAKTALATRQAQFQSQVDGHKRIIFKVVGAFTWHPDDQQDLAQEIAIQLWRAYPKYDPKRLFSTWMYQIALNTAISWSRKSKLRAKHLAAGEDLTDLPQPQPEENRSQALYSLIETLDELNRALLMLYIEEHSYAEIGEILGITPANVAVKLSRLKAQLRLEAGQQDLTSIGN